MWKPDKMLIGEKKKALKGLLEKNGQVKAGNLSGWLEALGTLVFIEQTKVACEFSDRASDHIKNEITNAFKNIDDQLDKAAAEISLSASELSVVEEDDYAELEERIVEALAVRDRYELMLEGAKVVLGKAPEMNDEVRASVLSFDEMLGQEAWRLLSMGSRRAARSVWAAPKYRERLWWWFRGSDLPETALDDLAIAARVIHLFPQARKELERLIKAEGDLEKIVLTAEQEAEIISIVSHLKKRYKSASGYTYSEQLRIAAADQDDERLLFEMDQVSLSMNRESLIVDYENISALPGKKVKHPVILIAPGLPDLPAKPTENGRYEIGLDAEQFGAKKAKLKVKLKKGAIIIDLPFREES